MSADTKAEARTLAARIFAEATEDWTCADDGCYHDPEHAAAIIEEALQAGRRAAFEEAAKLLGCVLVELQPADWYTLRLQTEFASRLRAKADAEPAGGEHE